MGGLMENTGKSQTTIRVQGQVIIILAAMVVVATAAFAAGYVTAITTDRNRTIPNLKVFTEAWNLANNEFYYEKPAETERMYAAISGMMATFKDQFTVFVPPETAAANTQLMDGETGGIGAKVAVDPDGQFVITEALMGKPAAEAGIKAGDIIVSIDDKPVTNLDIAGAIKLIRGPIGTQVKLTLKRAGESFDISVTRRQINIFARMLPDQIGYISLSLFSKTAPAELETELKGLLKDNPRALILDLRGNPGGYLDESLKIADLFLPEGPIASEKSSSGDVQRFTAHTGQIAENIQLVVLVDKDSASASEIVAGALEDRHRAVLVGTRTYGKGSVQSLFTLSDGSQLRITHGAWYTPNETPIQRDGQHIGLMPNILVTLPDKPTPNADPILDAAIKYINSIY
jgi:carboxyl-terminal processing protease